MASIAAIATKGVRDGYAKAVKCDGQDSCEPADHFQDALIVLFNRNVLNSLHISLEMQEVFHQRGHWAYRDAVNSVGFLGREMDLIVYTDRSAALYTDDGRGPADARVVRGNHKRVLQQLVLEGLLAPLSGSTVEYKDWTLCPLEDKDRQGNREIVFWFGVKTQDITTMTHRYRTQEEVKVAIDNYTGDGTNLRQSKFRV